MISAENLELIDDQRAFLFGNIALAQTDLRTLVAIASSADLSDNQVNTLVRDGYGEIASEMGMLLASNTKSFYENIREANGGSSTFKAKTPSFADFYEQRKKSSISVNTNLKYSQDFDELVDKLTAEIVAEINAYSFRTIDFIGADDNEFLASLRVPRADACGFCRWKAAEFSIYGTKLDHIVLHTHCRCISAPGFSFTDEGYLADAAQDLFNDRFDEIMMKKGLSPQYKDDLSLILKELRSEYKYG